MKNKDTQYYLYCLPKKVKWLAVCLLIVPALSFAQENILVVMSGSENIYESFYVRLKNKLENKASVSKIEIADHSSEIVNKYNYVITVGQKAANLIKLTKPETTVIHALIADYDVKDKDISCNNKSCYKVFINQPVSRYIDIFKIVFPENKNLVYATSENTSGRNQKIRSAAKRAGLKYKEIAINEDSNISRLLLNRLDNNDVLLALSDPSIYNSDSAKSVILSAYHKNVPIIAYSKSFSQAGALLSLYSSINNVADKTAYLTNEIISNGHQTMKEHYPDDFSIEINSAVAKSFNIKIDSAETIKRKMK